MNEWIDTKMAQDMLNENNDTMNRNQNWVVGERITGIKTKRVEFFIRAKTRVRFYELKSKAWDKCVEEGLHVTVKTNKNETCENGRNVSRSVCNIRFKRMTST